jgi:hypothetical protein
MEMRSGSNRLSEGTNGGSEGEFGDNHNGKQRGTRAASLDK